MIYCIIIVCKVLLEFKRCIFIHSVTHVVRWDILVRSAQIRMEMERNATFARHLTTSLETVHPTRVHQQLFAIGKFRANIFNGTY